MLSFNILVNYNYFLWHTPRQLQKAAPEKTPEVRPLRETGLTALWAKLPLFIKWRIKMYAKFLRPRGIFSQESSLYRIFENCIERSMFTKLYVVGKRRLSFYFYNWKNSARCRCKTQSHPWYSKMEIFLSTKIYSGIFGFIKIIFCRW